MGSSRGLTLDVAPRVTANVFGCPGTTVITSVTALGFTIADGAAVYRPLIEA